MLFCRSLSLAILLALLLCGWGRADEPSVISSLKPGKILFLGNSITLHGPAPKIGWEGNWGMAASAKEKDYVHLLTARIAKSAGATPKTMVKNIADFERTLAAYDIPKALKAELEFEADVVVLAIGENAAPLATDEAKRQFQKALVGLITELRRHGKPTVFVCGCFMTNHAKDAAIQNACKETGVTYVDNSKLGGVEANLARSERKFEHAGVAGHPGDRGMQARADAIWEAMQKTPAAKR